MLQFPSFAIGRVRVGDIEKGKSRGRAMIACNGSKGVGGEKDNPTRRDIKGIE
jgi:hypothetical protein